jgi:hypothetical protein
MMEPAMKARKQQVAAGYKTVLWTVVALACGIGGASEDQLQLSWMPDLRTLVVVYCVIKALRYTWILVLAEDGDEALCCIRPSRGTHSEPADASAGAAESIANDPQGEARKSSE